MIDITRRRLLTACGLVVLVVALWVAGKVLIESWFPPSPTGEQPWAARGQFGDMFGAVTSLMTAINLALLVYAILLQVSEASRQNEISKWSVNYNYLLDAKKLIVDHPEVLELHGLPADLHKTLGVTRAQLAYVVIDLKAADLYYRIEGARSVRMTEYREHMLQSKKYRAIARKVVVDGQLLPESPFTKTLKEALRRTEAMDQPAAPQDGTGGT